MKPPKAKGGENLKEMSMDHIVKCSKIQQGRQEATDITREVTNDHQGNCVTDE